MRVAYRLEIETNDADKTDDIMDTLERVAAVTLEDYEVISDLPIGDVTNRLMVLLGELTRARVGIDEILHTDVEGSHPDYITEYRNSLLAISAVSVRTLADMETMLKEIKDKT